MCAEIQFLWQKIGKWNCAGNGLTLCPLGPRGCKSVAAAAKKSDRGDLWSLSACQKLMGSARALRRVEWNPNKRSRHFLLASFSIKLMVMMMKVSFLLKLVWSWRSHWWLCTARTMLLLTHTCCIISQVHFSSVFLQRISQEYSSSVFLKCIFGCALVGQCSYSLMHNPRCATCINPIGSTNWPFQRTNMVWFTEQIKTAPTDKYN